MVKKLKKTGEDSYSSALGDTVKASAQQIWLAGLGAFSKAQEEGGKVFEALVKEGVSLQRKTQSAAEEKLSEATSRMANMATDLSNKASGQWDKLEGIFEERVARAMKKLGMPSAGEVQALVERIEELERRIDRQGGAPAKKAPARKSARPARPTAAAAPARKRAPRKAAAG